MSKFKIELCSDVDYEEMVVDISYEGRRVATIIQEKGKDNMEIKIYTPALSDSWMIPLDEFLKTLMFAKESLCKMQKLP